MPVECYRVVDSGELPDGKMRVETYSLGPDNTNLEALLKMAAPGVQRARETIGDLGGNHSARYRIAPPERGDALALLESHRAPVVTAIDAGCDISMCLDFYAHPIDGEPGQDWERTAIGELVYEAKYRPGTRGSRAAVLECGHRVVSYIESHPVLRTLTGVAAMPGWHIGITSRLLTQTAKAVSEAFGVRVVELERTGTAKPQKDLGSSDDPDANQRGTMSASILSEPDLIVVVDDLMAHGSTVREASRALREAGALRIASVTLAKDRTGTSRFVFERGSV